MAKHEVGKSLEAVRLNKRTGIPLTEAPITIPYGAILNDLEEVGNYYKFTYHSERYQMRVDSARGALHLIAGTQESVAKETPAVIQASNQTVVEEPIAEDSRPVLTFERLRVTGGPALSRAKVPGGWLIVSAGGVTFVQDAYHAWDGGSHV